MPDVAAVQFAEYGSPDVLAVRRIPAPVAAAGEVVVDIHAASVNPIDWKLRAGLLHDVFPAHFPVTAGRDGAGVVSAVGEGVDAGRIGQRVCFLAPRGAGSWAEQVAMPSAQAVAFPDALPFTDAAALPLGGLSAWAGLVATANVASGMRVLIHAAAGGVGTFAVQIARDRGAEVIATCSQANVAFVRALGADEVIAYDRERFDEKLSNIDVVFDPLGGEVHRRSYKVLSRGGLMVCLTAAPYQDESAAYGVDVKRAQVLPDPVVLAELVALAVAGRVRPVVEHVRPFADFAAAQAESETGHARGKTVLQIR
ncbi:MAG: NADP-dependent oxidoreductase [Pseudolabrys sp.]|jgi:NADPH:quinone reductase-like Zn-dependent oxidoreductase